MPLALVFKDGSSRRWAFVSLVGVLFIPLIAPWLLAPMSYAPIGLLILRPLRKAIPLLSLKTPIFEARRWKL